MIPCAETRRRLFDRRNVYFREFPVYTSEFRHLGTDVCNICMTKGFFYVCNGPSFTLCVYKELSGLLL